MLNKELFIQDLKECTTVLQQLETIKRFLIDVDYVVQPQPKLYCHNINIVTDYFDLGLRLQVFTHSSSKLNLESFIHYLISNNIRSLENGIMCMGTVSDTGVEGFILYYQNNIYPLTVALVNTDGEQIRKQDVISFDDNVIEVI